MSSEALAWAFKQTCKSSSVKFTLVAMCECANYRTGVIHPSIDHLSEITGQNRKTIIANVAELEASGVIVDTGERIGRTKQIKVYRLAMETVPKTEQSQKRNSTENAPKQSQKRDTEPSKEPSCSTEPKGSSEHKAREAKPFRMMADWSPSPLPSNVQALVDLWPPGRFEREIDQFRDYWLDRTDRRPGWDRTFHNRIRDIHDRVMRETRNDRPASNDQGITNPYARAVVARQAERAGHVVGQPDSWP
ncbi:hypothetical protein Saro_3007 [Novosphingobium aromaticivorans DSM 12444]|uniref:Uncharacterized protein n=1 Tax=Novosphingobium aromaticivorans (strain ATCC 700278 / DSM 12444 / CCUG 56034 / CIP 105152 / NBRC 16084 / F199) TaxID=279238 RepID=Q2G3Y1_NOVAD|nr:helix-turn-helix domain-containing protein [Novosphingobium aromaticivorans]ABD27442.1 hypothetical protein Saro_3007 [Novosphingobium aromaticivorans DSM 12444]